MSAARPDAAGVLHRAADRPDAKPARTRSPPTATRSGCCSRSPPQRTGKAPATLDIDDLDAPLIGAFLDHLEHERGNSVRTRNARLAAIRSLFRYAALRHPEHAATIQRVLAIPPKAPRQRARHVPHRTRDRRAARRTRPQSTWIGRRDHALLLLAAQTGLRASELIGLTCGDVHLGVGAHVSCLGKGRKQRITPLTKQTVAVCAPGLAERDGQPDRPAVPDQHRPHAQPRRARAPPRQARRDRRRDVPVAHRQDGHAARAAPHRRDAPAARRRRHHRDRALARPRADRDHPDLPPRRPRASRNRRSPGPPRRPPSPAATGPPTRSSRSSKRSDYADQSTPARRPEQGLLTPSRHNARIGIVALMPTSA